MIAKDLLQPELVFEKNSDATTVDDIAKKSGKFRCRFCGQPMDPYQEFGRAVIWRCWSSLCPNNIDSRITCDINDVDTKLPNDPSKSWRDWKPKRLV